MSPARSPPIMSLDICSMKPGSCARCGRVSGGGNSNNSGQRRRLHELLRLLLELLELGVTRDLLDVLLHRGAKFGIVEQRLDALLRRRVLKLLQRLL